MARLTGIQKAMETHHTTNLRRLEREIKEELERVLTQEELLAFPKTSGLVSFGDRNLD